MTTEAPDETTKPRTRAAKAPAKPRSVTFDLEYPVTIDGHDVSQVTLRRPKGRDIMASDHIKGTNAAKALRMVANLSELPEDTLLEMDAGDYMRLVGFVGECMGVSQDVTEA